MKDDTNNISPWVYLPVLTISAFIAIFAIEYGANNSRHGRYYVHARSHIGHLKTVMFDQATYHADNQIYATIEELAKDGKIDLILPAGGYFAEDIMKPTAEFYAIVISPVEFSSKEYKHFFATSSGGIRVSTVRDHIFHNMTSTQASIDKINLLPLAK